MKLSIEFAKIISQLELVAPIPLEPLYKNDTVDTISGGCILEMIWKLIGRSDLADRWNK